MEKPHRQTSAARPVPSLASALLACLLWAMPASSALAGGWTQPDGETYLKLWGRGLFGSSGYDAQGEVFETDRFTDLQLNLYGEHGLTGDWTAIFYAVPTGYARVLRDTWYVGPLGLGLRRALWSGELKVAAEARYTFESGVGGIDLLSRAASPSTGPRYVPAVDNHSGDLELQFGHGLSFGWVTVGAGLRLNGAQAIDHAVIANAQLGVQTGNFQFDLHLQTYQPLGEVMVVNVAGVGQTRYLGFGLGVGYRFGEMVSAVAAFDGAGAQSNAAAPSLQAGAELRRKP